MHKLSSLPQEILPHRSIYDSSQLLDRCSEEKDGLYALRVHAYMAASGLDALETPGNRLVCIMGTSGCMSDAQRVFDRLIFQDQLSWDTLIRGYLNCGQLHDAIKLYIRKQKFVSFDTDSHTTVALLKACAKLKDLGSGLELQTWIVYAGLLEVDAFIGSSLVDMFAKCGSLTNAQQVFVRLRIRNAVCWNALIAAFVKCGHSEQALQLFKRMQLEGISPDAVTFICSLKACANVGSADMAHDIHELIKTRGFHEGDLVVGNTLVDVFAKLGLLDKAQRLFDSLPLRDAISWNSLITGYVEHGHGDKAVECYEKMQGAGIAPNSVTYICAMKAFTSIGAPSKGLEIHGELERLGLLEQDCAFGNTLVDMYAQGGWFLKAKEVFDKLPVRDIVAWNALIAGYAEYGNGKESLNYYEQMQHERVTPDSITLVCSLKACGLVGAIDKGREIHAEIERGGLAKNNQVVGNAVVDFYAKCSMLHRAREVFDALPGRDVIAWNIMVAGYAEHGYCEEALKCLDAMQSHGVFPDNVTFVYGLKACNSEISIRRARHIHAEIERQGLLEKDPVVGNALLDMYCKFGLLSIAQELFDILPVQDHFSWNTLIAGYAEHGTGEEALDCFERMQSQGVSADAVTFLCGLKACGGVRALSKGSKMHAEIERRGLLIENHPIGSTLVDMYGKCGAIVKAQEVFDRLPFRDSIAWNALLAGYTEQGCAEGTLKCLHQMRQGGVPLNVAAVVCSLKACARIGATSEGQRLLAEIKQKRFLERNYLVSSTLVDMCVKCNSIAKAQEMFDQLLVRDVVSWNVLMTGYAENGQIDEALTCLKKMQHEGVAPDAVTYISSLKACGTMGATLKGQEIHTEIMMKGLLEREPSLGNTLIYMYSRCGAIMMAQRVFDKLMTRDVVSWNTLIAGYAQVGQNEGLFCTFSDMLGQRVKPDLITFVIVLNACSRSCLFHESHSYFEAMSTHHGIVPCLEHHSCVVDLLARAGQLDEAAAIIKKMPICPNVVVWHALLGACKSWGNVQVGSQAFRQAVDLDDQDSAAYVLWSHIHSDDIADQRANGS
ncbi:hypothetical protein GOP47_0013022 [Adiantum capillus-veneris]|uniref:Pentatricopeptide repeat-containing protein n=1 Tax=Adiantum capillus-veneris TaxID=13818 RepID=A0A9D4USB9_ADICA|nr:hypothetical protein GOP47_0013022 [Adiantum capillus-veneris]